MNITQEKSNELTSVIKIHLTPDDYNPKVESELKKIHRSISIPGFRPGKAPFDMVRKRFGRTVLIEELNKILSDSLYKFLSENKVKFLGNPIPKDSDTTPNWDNPSDFEFEYEIGHVPDFEIRYPSEPLTSYSIKASEAMTDQYIDELSRRFGKHSYPEVSGENDILYGDFNELDENGELKAGGHHTTTTLAVDMIKNEEEKKKFIGLRKEDTVNFNPTKVLDNETEVTLMLNLKKDSPQLNSDYRFTVKTINHLEKLPIGQELYDKYAGTPSGTENAEAPANSITNENDFRVRVKSDYEKYLSRDNTRFMNHNLRHTILAANPIPLPADFLKRWMMTVSETPVTMETVEKEFAHQAEELRWKLLRDKMVETYNLNVTEDEKNTVARQLVLSQFSRYGIYEVPEDKMQELSKQYLSDKKIADNIIDRILDDKVIEQYKVNTPIKEQEIDYDEFLKIVNAHEHEHHHTHEHEHEHAHE
jgi:trigger factor